MKRSSSKSKARGTYGMHLRPASKPGKVVAGMYDLMPDPKALPQKAHKRTAADIRAGK
jgi:hypothetical protein